MRSNPYFGLQDPDVVKRLVRENPWATLVSATDEGLVASHYPVILDETRELSLLSHVGRPDEQLHQLGERELLMIVQGPHGYISSSWYGPAPAVPTWNFIVAHLYGVPEILAPGENLDVLGKLVDHFEAQVTEPRPLHRTDSDSDYERALSRGTVGFRLARDTFLARLGATIEIARASPDDADVVFTAAAAPMLAAYVYGGVPLAELEAQGVLAVTGDRAAAARFRALFPLPAKLAA